MFELLATVDPFSALLGSLWLFAAGMFPAGFILGSSCSCHCASCDTCLEGSLPQTVTLSLSGFGNGTIRGPWLCPLTFSSCYGSGAQARVTAPGGNADTDKGPISTIEIANGGSGYAQLGRVAPLLTIAGSGTGATFAPTFSVSQDACGRETWSIASIAASGGTGYVDGEWLSIAASEGDTQIQAAAAKLYVGRSEPTITLNGTATTTVQLADNGDNTWRIAGVTVTDGGSGYSELGLVTFNAGPDGVVVPNQGAIARARVIHEEPSNANAIIAISTSGGSGAVLQPVWELLPQNQWPAVNRKTYRLASVTVVNGGSGYQQFERIEVTFPTVNASVYGLVYQQAYIDVDAVDGNGAIEAVYVDPPGGPNGGSGSYRGARTDQLHSVLLAPETVGPPGNVFTACPTCRGGSYYRNDPTARRVVVTAGGSYYREDASVPPYVATVTVGVSQIPPSDGTGAELSAVIDDDPESETFGEITAVNIDDGGDGYLAHEWCESYMDGVSVVLPLTEEGDGTDLACHYYKADCGRSFRVDYRGPGTPPRVLLAGECGTTEELNTYEVLYELEAPENVVNCSEMSFTATDASGRSATVSAGGVATERTCADCTGHVLVRGVEVPVNTGEYVLVSVDPAPTSVKLTAFLPGGLGISNITYFTVRTYAVAQAFTLCGVPGLSYPGDGYPGFAHENMVVVLVWVYGIGTGIWSGIPQADPNYDALVVGSKRMVDPAFAPYAFVITRSPLHVEVRSLGAVRGDNCFAEGTWQLVEETPVGPEPVWDSFGHPDGWPFIPPGWTGAQPPSAAVLRVATRQFAYGEITCGPI